LPGRIMRDIFASPEDVDDNFLNELFPFVHA
jgi:hypothetical protein